MCHRLRPDVDLAGRGSLRLIHLNYFNIIIYLQPVVSYAVDPGFRLAAVPMSLNRQRTSGIFLQTHLLES